MALLLRGAPVANELSEAASVRAAALASRGVTPTLAIVRVGERADDLAYERGALKRCERVGVSVRRLVFPEDVRQEVLLDALERTSADDSVHGCLVFRPLPDHLDEEAVCAAIDPAKDVDGVTEGSLYGVFAGREQGFPPCTARAVLALLDHYGYALEGARVAVVGRSLVIGRPVALMLLARNATVTLCHTRTVDLDAEIRRADIVVAAAGRPGVVGKGSLRTGQVVVDVGINWDDVSSSLVGDVDFGVAEGIVDAITPVPGGVGSVTTAVLALQVVEAAERSCR
ncbi:MAG TPA: bifunctional 5,10-methylenetetrahydrofolate dehydrogenase/5,10-methenyltetrahydrofolate cyclohydrolase [Candidatus Olsenella excrementavium]|uniref:Bifunctional protein FolD n=1 Tax=Candidatus Olsenella excrementavium TaxID=2838709 RepID=A0A9D1ZA07_9ACTN|nr:bifunctional 5,10-methylenetetrahydrofolate dehydrogenase/5,10-methenyltetrahydrofolate cyclohydrolase [Candidatus Olsenella excrementavium]